MRNSTSILSLVLALGIYGAGPIVTKFGPFAATVAHADGGEGGGGSGGGSGGGDGGNGGGGDSGGNDERAGDSDNGTVNDSDEGAVNAPSDDDNGLCDSECNDN